ncbi:protein tyrosine kinase [Dictyocaulus viviparus]|uniref:non-specific protein-tyrosine kinase n=1 Tax=Dictyocaulus viviparus TaxID=29172 RepID=A0A0D8XUQ3_DICVI|nr:protein tyrosine kinase [Dictyocaulus viviparus]
MLNRKKGSKDRNAPCSRRSEDSVDERRKSSSLIGVSRVKSSTRELKSNNDEFIDSGQEEQFKLIDKTLTKYNWFHGMMPRIDCEEMLKKDGDFLVRRTTVNKLLTYCISDSTVTLADLVNLYVTEKRAITSCNAILLNAVSRPDYFVLHENIILGKKLGRGAFGEVYSGKLKVKNGEIDVAIKKAKEGKMKKHQINAFIREAKIMRRLDHPNIVRMYGVAVQEEPVMILLELAKNGSLKEAKIMRRLDHPNIVRMYGVAVQEEPVMILLELAKNGSLKAYYKKNENVSVDQKLNFARDACRGMCYLSLAKIIHRDLAARNCLLGAKFEVKISDFGLSVAGKQVLRLNKLHKVPVKWLSPETITEGVFTTKTDVWSFGVLMWEIFANCKSDPFPGETNANAVTLITNKTPPMDPPPNSPLIVKEVMNLCFVKVPDNRPDFVQVLRLLSPNESPPLFNENLALPEGAAKNSLIKSKTEQPA